MTKILIVEDDPGIRLGLEEDLTLEGLRIGLVDNTKHNSDQLLLRIANILEEKHGAKAHVIRRKKSAGSPQAPTPASRRRRPPLPCGRCPSRTLPVCRPGTGRTTRGRWPCW